MNNRLIAIENNHYRSRCVYQDVAHRAEQRQTGSVHQYSQLLFNTRGVLAMVIQHIKALSDMNCEGGKIGSCKEILDKNQLERKAKSEYHATIKKI